MRENDEKGCLASLLLLLLCEETVLGRPRSSS
jgi:hypothetical protein